MSETKRYSVRALVFVAVYLVLQLFPLTGVFLSFFLALLGPYVIGFIPHLVPLGIIVDVYNKQISHVFLLIPLLLYSSYYLMYFAEGYKIQKVEAAIQSENPVQLLQYDPMLHTLVLKSGGDFIAAHKLPVVFSSRVAFSKGAATEYFIEYRKVTKELCGQLKTKSQNAYIKKLYRSQSACVVSQSLSEGEENFNDVVIRVYSHNTNQAYNTKEDKRAYQFSFGLGHYVFERFISDPIIFKYSKTFRKNDEVLGEFFTANVKRLPIFPFFIFMCGVEGVGGTWECGGFFYRQSITIDTFPKSINTMKYGDNPAAFLLGIEKVLDDHASLQDDADTLEFIKKYNKLEVEDGRAGTYRFVSGD